MSSEIIKEANVVENLISGVCWPYFEHFNNSDSIVFSFLGSV